MVEEGEYVPNPQVDQGVQGMTEYLRGADVKSVRGQSFVDFTLITKLTSAREGRLNELKSHPFPAPGTETSRKNYDESELRISEVRLALIANEMDYKKMTLPGYKEELASIEQKWRDLESAAGHPENIMERNKLLDHVTDKGMQTLLQGTHPQE